MKQAMPDDLWRDFPKTATEFEARFATEKDCRAYWIEARWVSNGSQCGPPVLPHGGMLPEPSFRVR
jgi:hypothetical protein